MEGLRVRTDTADDRGGGVEILNAEGHVVAQFVGEKVSE